MNAMFTRFFDWNNGLERCYSPCFSPICLRMSRASSPDDNPKVPATAPADEIADARIPHPLIVRMIAWRKAKGWTQEEAASHLEIPLNTLRGYECGNRNPGGTNTEKILAVVGLPKSRNRQA